MVRKTREVVKQEWYVECDKCGREITGDPFEVNISTTQMDSYGDERHEDKDFHLYFTKQYCSDCRGDIWNNAGVFHKLRDFILSHLDIDE